MLVTRGTRNTLNAVVNRVRKLSKLFVPALKKCRRCGQLTSRRVAVQVARDDAGVGSGPELLGGLVRTPNF